MAKNLEKQNNSTGDPEESFNDEMRRLMAGASNTEQDADIEEDEDEDQDEGLEEDDIPQDNESEEDEEPEGSPDDFEDDEDEDEEPDKQTKALVYWKKRAKAAEKLAGTPKQAPVQKQPQKVLLESLKADLIKKGYDEDTADFMAQQTVEIQELKQRTAISDFKAENANLLSKYPNARSRIPEILSKMEAAGFSAEQVCVAMFGQVSSPKDARAKASVKDSAEPAVGRKDVSNLTNRTEQRRDKATISQADVKKKQDFENKFGIKMDNKRWLEVKQEYNL